MPDSAARRTSGPAGRPAARLLCAKERWPLFHVGVNARWAVGFSDGDGSSFDAASDAHMVRNGVDAEHVLHGAGEELRRGNVVWH